MPPMACCRAARWRASSDSKLKSLVVTDSIAATEEIRKCPNIRRISIAPLIGEAMRRINNEESVSSLFD